MFAFRFRTWKTPRRLVVYFATFFCLELAAEHVLLPPGLLGVEVAMVCFAIAAIFVLAIRIAQRYEVGEEEEP